MNQIISLFPALLLLLYLLPPTILSKRVHINLNDRLTGLTLEKGEHTFVLNTTQKSCLELYSTHPIQLQYEYNGDFVQTQNFTFDRFIANYIVNGSNVFFNNVSVNTTMTVRIWSTTTMNVMMTKIIDLENKVESQIVDKLEQIFQFDYRKTLNSPLQTNAFQIDIRADLEFALSVSSFGSVPYPESENYKDGKFYGSLKVGVSIYSMTLVQDVYSVNETFFLYFKKFDESDGRYRVTVTKIYNIEFKNYIYLALMVFLVILTFSVLLFGCVKCLQKYYYPNTRQDENVFNRAWSVNHEGESEETKIILPVPDALEYQKRRETLKDTEICCVCLDYKKIIKFKPCNHICTCDFCSKAVLKTSGLCPLCRTKIEDMEKIDEEEVDERDYDGKEEESVENEKNDDKELEKEEKRIIVENGENEQ